MGSSARKWAIRLLSILSGLVVVLALVVSSATSAAQPRPAPAVSSSGASAPSPEALTQSLRALTARYLAAGPGERDDVLRELDGIARARQRALAALAETEPAAVLRLAVPSGLRASLPGAVQPYVEHDVELEGELEVLVEDRDPGSRYLYFLQTPIERLSLHFAGDAPALQTGARVRVKGLRVDTGLVLPR